MTSPYIMRKVHKAPEKTRHIYTTPNIETNNTNIIQLLLEMKQDMTEMKQKDLTELKQDITMMNQNVIQWKEEVSKEVAELQSQAGEVEDKLEQECEKMDEKESEETENTKILKIPETIMKHHEVIDDTTIINMSEPSNQCPETIKKVCKPTVTNEELTTNFTNQLQQPPQQEMIDLEERFINHKTTEVEPGPDIQETREEKTIDGDKEVNLIAGDNMNEMNGNYNKNDDDMEIEENEENVDDQMKELEGDKNSKEPVEKERYDQKDEMHDQTHKTIIGNSNIEKLISEKTKETFLNEKRVSKDVTESQLIGRQSDDKKNSEWWRNNPKKQYHESKDMRNDRRRLKINKRRRMTSKIKYRLKKRCDNVKQKGAKKAGTNHYQYTERQSRMHSTKGTKDLSKRKDVNGRNNCTCYATYKELCIPITKGKYFKETIILQNTFTKYMTFDPLANCSQECRKTWQRS